MTRSIARSLCGRWTSCCKLSGNFQPNRRLLKSLMPENEVNSDRDSNVTTSVDVPLSDNDEVAARTPELRNGTDENNTAENHHEEPRDVQNMTQVGAVGDDATTRRLQQLAKQLTTQVIQFVMFAHIKYYVMIRVLFIKQCKARNPRYKNLSALQGAATWLITRRGIKHAPRPSDVYVFSIPWLRHSCYFLLRLTVVKIFAVK